MDIMRMALTQGCGRDLHKLAVLVQCLDRRAATVTHTGADTSDHLENRIIEGALVSDTTLDTFRNELSRIFLEIAVF